MIIADTSVISSFATIKRVDLLEKLVGIYITNAVFLELLESRDEELLRGVKRHIEKFIFILDLSNLRGEIEEFKERNYGG